jgi:16S rRNA (guanine1207-N2)-methyltransferase
MMPENTYICRISEEYGEVETSTETFLDNRCTVISRSGLSVTESHFVETIPFLCRTERLLILGNRTGVFGMMAAHIHPHLNVVVSSLDQYHHHAVERNLLRNHASRVTSRCEPDVPEHDHYDDVCLQASKGAQSDELIQDLLQQSHLALKMGGRCFVTVEEGAPRLAEQMRKLFGNCSIQGSRKDSTLLIGRKKEALKKIKIFRAEFAMTLPHGLPITLATVPGVFAHRRVDPGAQALAEVVQTQPEDAILDMGCGCGSVGIALAKNQPTASVCLVDSHSRATAMAAENCRTNGISRCSIILSDQGLTCGPCFTLVVGNPPYYSHNRIADLFIRTAHETLVRGGRVYLVAKNAAHYVETMQDLFGHVETLHRRGYQIVKSVKSKS